MKKILTFVLIISTVFLVNISGCAVSKKPAPKPTPPAKITPTPTPAKKPAVPAAHALATKLSDAAQKVEGVKSATVVVSGSTAFVGLEIKPGIEDKKTNEIKTKVADVVKKADNRIKAVNVTTDPNLITRLKRIADGIKKGKPISSFADELAEITRRIVPKTK